MENEWIENLRNWASSAPLIAKVWIYGSRVKGIDKEASDLDVAIEMKSKDKDEQFSEWFVNVKYWRTELGNIFENGPAIHLELVSDDDEIVLPAVLDHGILIYPPESGG